MTSATISFLWGQLCCVVVAGILLVGHGESSTVPMVGVDQRLFGAFYVSMSIILTPQLGASSVICGQMMASIVVEHFGLLNLPTSPANLPKLGGAALVIIGAITDRSKNACI